MSCGELKETLLERDRRIDAMLREMVVLEGLESLSEGRPVRGYELKEIGDFVGVGAATILRIERKALKKIREKVI